MARHLSEMMLIVRAQNQASGALRRVGRDLSQLGRHRNLQIQQQKTLLQQQKLLSQRQRALRELSSITQGSRAISLQRDALSLEKRRNMLAQRRASIMGNQRALATTIATAQARAERINNDMFRTETARLRLANRMAQIQAQEAQALRSRRNLQARVRRGTADPAGLEDSARAIQALRRQATILDRDLQSNAARQEELRRSSSLTSRAIGTQVARSAQLGRQYRSLTQDEEILGQRTAHLAARQAELAKRANEVRSQLGQIATRYAIVNQQQRDLTRQIRVARWEPISTLGRTIQHVGRVGQYATLIFGGGLAYAAHNAAMFEKEVMKVATQTGKVDANFGRTTATIVKNSKFLGRAFLNIQRDSTSSMAQIQEAGYDLFSTLDQLGESQEGLRRGARILKLFSDAAIAGGTDIGTVGDGVIATLSAFEDMPQTVGGVNKLLNRMFAAVRFGRMTFAEFAQTLGTTTPAARAAGQTFDTLAGTIAFLSKPLGINKASVGFARLTEILARKKFVDGLKKAGVNITDTNGKLLQMPDVIDRITKKFPQLTKGGTKLMQFFKEMSGTEGTIQARRAFVFLAQDLEGYRRILQKTVTDNNEFDRSLKTMEQTSGVRWEKFMNQIRAAVTSIGQDVLPEILKLSPHVERLANWFHQLDPEVRGNAVRMAALAVALLAVGSAIAFLLGPAIRLVALLAKSRIGLLGWATLLTGAAVAVGVLTGDWRALNAVVNSFFSLTDQGAWGWIAMFGIATVGALRLAKAIQAVRAAWIASAAVTAVGTSAGALGGMAGFFGRGRRGISDIRGASRIVGETSRNAGRLRGLLTGAGLAAAAIPGPLWIAGGAIAAAAGGALLWQRRQKSIADEAERAKVAALQALAISSRPQTQAADLGNLGTRITDAKKLGIEYKRQVLLLQELQQQFKGASGRQKQLIGLDIQDSIIRVNEYYRMWHQSQARVTATSAQLKNAITSQSIAMQSEITLRQKINKLQERLAYVQGRLSVPGGQRATHYVKEALALESQLKSLRTQLQLTQGSANKTAGILRKSFTSVVRDLQAGAVLPKNISQGAIDAALRVALARGRMLKPQEIKAVVRAYADKAALARAKADIQAAVKTVKVDLRIGRLQTRSRNLQEQMRAAIHSGDTDQVASIRTKLEGTKEAIANAKTARSKIVATFRKTIVQNVKVKVTPPNTEPLGFAISNGIAAGINAGLPNVQAAVNALIAEIQRAAAAKAEIRSPSRLFERTIGAPIVDGIIKGMLNKDKIERAAALTMSLFSGAFLQRRQELIDNNDKFDPLKLEKLEQQAEDARARFNKRKRKIDEIRAREYERKAAEMRKHAKKLTVADLIKDTQQQAKEFRIFNNALKSLSTKIPAQMLEDLRGLGIEGLQYIKLLAGATPSQLKKMVNAWKQMQAQIKRSQAASIADTKEFNAAQKEQLKELTETAANTLLDKWNEFKQRNAQQFGDLFSGPLNLADRIGQSLQDAIKQYDEQVTDFNRQIDDLTQQINDLHASALRERTDQLQQAFGTLFSGEWMTGHLGQIRSEWGIAPTFDDLFNDLQSQLDRFTQWRDTLASLAAKVPPELAAQLEALGPEAIQSLQSLNGATAEQIAQYIALWQQAQGKIGTVAGATYQTADFTSQLANLNNQILEVRNQMELLQKPLAVTGQDVISDLDAQISKWNEYETMLRTLKDRGVPLAIIQQIRDIGPEALPYLQALNQLTDQQLISGADSFVGKWKTAQDLIKISTNTAMNEQLKLWYSHGANIASALIAGVTSEQQALITFFSNLFSNLLQGKFPTMNTSTGGGTGSQSGYFYSGSPESGARRAEDYVPATNSYNTQSSSNLHMTVIAHQDESLMSTIERAAFRIRNRAE